MTTIVVPLYGYLKISIKGLISLARIAKERRLNLSHHDVVGNNVIALDTVRRKLLFMKRTPETSSCLVIDLKHLETCTLSKQYSSIDAGDLNKRKASDFLKRILLRLRFRDGSAAVNLPLYEVQNERSGDIEQLEATSKKWETIVSTLLPKKVLERA